MLRNNLPSLVLLSTLPLSWPFASMLFDCNKPTMTTSTQLRKILSRTLSQVRIARGRSQTELAKRMGVSPSLINHFESGRRVPTIVNLLRLADALEVSADVLLGRSKVA